MGTQISDRLVTYVEPITETILRDDHQLATAVRQAVGKLHLEVQQEHGHTNLNNIAIVVSAFINVKENQ